MKADNLEKVIQCVGDFPILPILAARVMQVLHDPYSSAADLTKIVSVDQAMAFRIVKMANSTFFGFPRSVATVTESIVLLGFATVRNLILTTMMYNFDLMWTEKHHPKIGDKNPIFNQRLAWKHSVATAIMTRYLLASQGLVVLEQMGFLAGLMHDVGKILFYHYFRENYLEVLKQNPQDGRSLSQLEEEIMGAHHGQVGGWIVDRWNLPEEIVPPIVNHHFPEETKEKKELTHALNIANRIAHETLNDFSGEVLPTEEGTLQGWNPLGLTSEQVQAMRERLKKELAEIECFMTV